LPSFNFESCPLMFLRLTVLSLNKKLFKEFKKKPQSSETGETQLNWQQFTYWRNWQTPAYQYFGDTYLLAIGIKSTTYLHLKKYRWLAGLFVYYVPNDKASSH
jgi:hypothetical protein